MIGAILTQNTSWKNVDKAITTLKEKYGLSLEKLQRISETELAQAIRSSGYYNQKAKKIKIFVRYIYERYAGSLEKMAEQPLEKLREELLTLYGIGPETADSILLYALQKPTFVVDAYTRRIFLRHGWMTEKATYEEIRQFFMTHLPRDVQLYNEFHALLVYVGHHFCRRTPLCDACPLNDYFSKEDRPSF
ncbi:MAG: endonuclease III domain-containing protein [Calditrichaeota bacterium]|nr:endonuclease III domain-containing protein [Calditrichota bacterium]